MMKLELITSSSSSRSIPTDGYCWQRPEDIMDYQRPVLREVFGAALAGEMTVALASASIVFRDDDDGNYSQTLINGATMLFKFAGDLLGKRTQPYNVLKQELVDYNSIDYYDEYIWAAAWMYCATGESSYLSLATNEELPKHAHAFSLRPADELRVLSWDNKLPAAALSLTRIRMMLSPAGYPGMSTIEVPPSQMSTAQSIRALVGGSGAATVDVTPTPTTYITGAVVGGPDKFDKFHDTGSNYNYTEPTILAGNTGLVAALVSLSTISGRSTGVDNKNIMFSAIPQIYPDSPPPWKPSI